MKQNDIVLLLVAVFFSLILSIIVSKYLFSTPAKLSQQVDVVPAITSNFPTPSSKYFNSQSIDPTQIINIGPNNNQNLF